MIYRNRTNTSGSINTLPYTYPTDIPINSGDITVFAQTNAPTGYTKLTTHNDKALRVVSGTAGSGGTTAFSTVFTNQTPTISGVVIDPTTITIPTMPGHTHIDSGVLNHCFPPYGAACYAFQVSNGTRIISSGTGGGGSHTHSGSSLSSSVGLTVSYIDIILAQKN